MRLNNEQASRTQAAGLVAVAEVGNHRRGISGGVETLVGMRRRSWGRRSLPVVALACALYQDWSTTARPGAWPHPERRDLPGPRQPVR